MKRKHDNSKAVYINGERFPSTVEAYHDARMRGFNGSLSAFRERLRKSDNPSWSDLLTPVTEHRIARGKKTGAIRAQRCADARAEMAALCADLDARKAAMRVAA